MLLFHPVSRRLDQTRRSGHATLRACRVLRDHARAIAGRGQQFTIAYAKALEVIPRQLCDNAGFDATDVLNKLRQVHAAKDGSGRNFGVDVNTGTRACEQGV
jgi:T-complex protein 1 subunit eta